MFSLSNLLRSLILRNAVVCAALLLLLAICGCGGGSKSTPVNYTGDGTSGLRGVVTGYGSSLGATPQPIANATVSAYLNSTSSPGVGAASGFGPLVAQTRSDAQGNYSLPLIPGFYLVGVASTSSTGSSGTGGGEATVANHQFVQLNVVINYGTP